MGGTRFKLDLNLQNLSMISIAAKLWDSQDIKNQIKNHFSVLDWDYLDDNWREISKLVVQYSNSINLPPSLSVLLKETILLIGKKIYDWTFYVNKILGLDLISTQKIYFNLGVVDEIKIFDLYWRDLMAFDNLVVAPHRFVYQSDYFIHSPLSSLACRYGCERFVKERRNEMLNELSEFYPQIKEGDEIYNIMSVSICMTAGERNVGSTPPPQRMFELCLENCYSKAARFYWEKLNEAEKVSNLTNFAKKCFHYSFVSFLIEKRCENLLFLINQMGEEEWYLFFTEYADRIIKSFLSIWPYQALIVDLLKYDWNIESSRLLEMVEFLISFSTSMNRLELPLDNDLVFQIMQKAWGNISVDDKLAFLKKNEYSISSYFLTLNPEILNLLFNDSNITEVDGKKMDYFIKEGFMELVKMGKFDFLNSIIGTVFSFISEPKEFLKKKISSGYVVSQLIENDESFGFLDRFLDWSAESEDERARLKNKINTISVCRYLTEPSQRSFKFELADKFLKWRLESAAEIKTFKEEMKLYNFVMVGDSEYVRIKSGDLSGLRRGDFLAIHPDDHAFNNADGLTFLKFEEATELNRGIVLGIKTFDSHVDCDFSGRDSCHPERWLVNDVGTKVGDFIVLNVHYIWICSCGTDFDLDKVVEISNAYIEFYYEADEEIVKFKKTKLRAWVIENLAEILLGALGIQDHTPETFLEDFCEFCLIPSEEIEEIKIQQRSGIEKFLDTYLIGQSNFRLVNYYLNWLFGEVEKTEVRKKFLIK